MFKKLLCFSAAFILCLTYFVIPSFATGNDFTPVPEFDSTPSVSELRQDGLQIDSTGGSPRYFGVGASTDSVYVFYYYVNSSTVNFRFISQSTFTAYTANPGWSTTSSENPTLFSSELPYYTTNSTYGYYVTNITDTIFSSVTDAVSAFDVFINNQSPPDPIYDDLPDFNIQRGYAAYIDFGSDWSSRSISGTLTSSFPQYSSLISGDWDGTDNRRYFWTSSLPSNTNFTSNVGSAIDWTKVPPYDLLQRSKNGIWFIQSNSPLNRYLVIINPNQWRYGQNPTDDTINSPITVSNLSGSTGDVKFFALNQKFDTDGTLVSATSDNANNNRTGTYDPNSGQWEMTDSSGNAADQVPGGESDTPVISSITDYIHNITSVLTNFANSVISLIQAPISHISELIDAGSGFMASLRGMYSWLPVDIQGLVISALTVVIGIGVFKVFL